MIGFAGHRQLNDSAAIKAALLAVLREWRDNLKGTCVGRASAAAGADLLFLDACRELGIPFGIVMPFPEDRFSDDFADRPADWALAKELMAEAGSIEIVPGNEVAPAAYHLAAREILDTWTACSSVAGMASRRAGIGGTEESVDGGPPAPHAAADHSCGHRGHVNRWSMRTHTASNT